MTKPVTVTAELDPSLSADLDRLATMADRSRAWLIERAVAAFVLHELEWRDSLEEAEAQIDRGEYITHDDLMAELRAEFGKRRAA